MDSMRHLSTSLPRQRNETSDILSDFRAAALSVTNLYKNAAKAQDRSRATGYQDALDDLLGFLDKENLGLGDGEGWRVRQWATERLDGDGRIARQGAVADSMADDDDDNSTSKDEDKEDERGSSPETNRKPQALAISTSDLTEEDSVAHRRVVSEPPQPPPSQQQGLLQSDFTFQSSHAYPTNHEREGSGGMELDGSTASSHFQVPSIISSEPSSAETLRIIRPSRNNRHGGRRNDNRTQTINFNLGSGAGSKRKLPYPDFFDISSLNEGGDRKDGNGNGRGGKRGRHV